MEAGDLGVTYEELLLERERLLGVLDTARQWREALTPTSRLLTQIVESLNATPGLPSGQLPSWRRGIWA